MGNIIEKYLTLFFVYSFLGWVMESVHCCIITKKFVNRGFLIGPYCPVYGIGVCLLTAWLTKYTSDIPLLFFMSMLICGDLEYFTSYIMEKVFKARWWDYSDKKFNINGRICLENLIPFGILGVILVKYLNSFVLNVLEFSSLKYILIFISIIFIIDLGFSIKGILDFRKATKQVETEVKDDTEEISAHMKELATEKYNELKELATTKSIELQKATARRITMIKTSASERFSGTKKDLLNLSRKINVSYKKALKKRQAFINNFIELHENLKERFMKTEKEKYANKLVRSKVKEKSWLTRRLLKAFPNMQVKIKSKKSEK